MGAPPLQIVMSLLAALLPKKGAPFPPPMLDCPGNHFPGLPSWICGGRKSSPTPQEGLITPYLDISTNSPNLGILL